MVVLLYRFQKWSAIVTIANVDGNPIEQKILYYGLVPFGASHV
jgi:hypothetical protein